jgi:hypothetical protein
MEEQEIRNKIEELKATLTGELLEDCETQAKIYELKKQLSLETNMTIEEIDDEDGDICLSCGS